MKKLLFFLATLLFGTACKKDSSDINQAKIFQNYIMTYDENFDKTTVSAYFYVKKLDGKKIELAGSSTIIMNGTTMIKSGTTYSTTVDGNLAVASLIFTDNDGKVYTNTINKANVIGIGSQNYLDNGSDTQWFWDGNSISTDETINLVFTNVADNSKSVSFSENVFERDYLLLSGVTLSNNLEVGNTKAEISRSKSINTGNFASVGGKITATFQAVYNYIEVI